MVHRLRVIDTGVGDGRMNIAQGQALVECHQKGLVPDTIRFLRFNPAAIMGRHQSLSQEVNVDHCRAHGVEIVRRITGGGAIYLDPSQLGWELAISKDRLSNPRLDLVAKEICEAMASGLSKLGIEAVFRPRNDIEVGGRKVSGTGGFFDGDTLFFQGTVIVDMNPADMMAALNIPAAKLAKHKAADGGQRIVTLKELLGDKMPTLATIQQVLVEGLSEALHYNPETADHFSDAELQLAQEMYDEEIGTEEFIAEIDRPELGRDVKSASATKPGGTIHAHVRTEGPQDDRIRELVITGDFFVTPPRLIMDLESALRQVTLDEVDQAVADFFASAKVDMLTAQPVDFADVIKDAMTAEVEAD